MDTIPLNKKNLEDYLIEINPHFSVLEPMCARFGLNQMRIKKVLDEKNAPKPDKLASNKAVFPMRSHKGWKYNIFTLQGGYYAGIVFDRYRRPYYQTLPAPTTIEAIKLTRDIIELLVKGQCVPIGFKLDEGKAIREKEENGQKVAAKSRR